MKGLPVDSSILNLMKKIYMKIMSICNIKREAHQDTQ